MKPLGRFLPLVGLALIWLSQITAAQVGRVRPGETEVDGSVRNLLIGDFKVEAASGATVPSLFHLILYTTNGQVVGRQTISNNGRYRFDNVSNGEYDLVVEVEGSPAARIRVFVNEIRRTDVRRDIAFEWRENPRPGGGTSGTISAAALYKRTNANQTLFNKADEAAKKKDYDQAITLYRQIVADDPKDFIVWTEIGTLHFKLGKVSDAEEFYKHALDENPAFVLALLNLGKVRISQKNFEGAIEPLTRAVQADAQSADANYLLGEAYLQVKKGSKAVGYLNEALRIDPIGKADAHLRLATLYNAAGMKDKAANEYEQFLSKKPDYADKKKLQDYVTENKKR